MKKVMGILLITGIVAFSCKESVNVSQYTGNEVTYALQQGSQYSISGTATFREMRDSTTTVVIELKGTQAGSTFPVHLHLGDISVDGAYVAALLNPVSGSTGKSETVVKLMADDSKVTYASLIKLNACLKIHLSDTGDGRNVILAAGNIGSASTSAPANARAGVAVCKSN